MPRRPLRADAQRNRARILAAATAVMAESGPQAPLDEIATRAAVGAGTLYRHFPSRDDLLLAVFAGRIEALCDVAEELTNEEQPGIALGHWLHEMLDHAMSDNGLLEALALTGSKPDMDCSAMIVDAASGLLGRAQERKAVRQDVTADDLLRLVIGIGMSTGDTPQAHHVLAIALEGLDPQPATSANRQVR